MAGALENSNAVFTISYRTSRKGKAAAKGSSKGKGKAKAAATSVVDIEHIDDDEETMSISTLTSATASTVQHIYSKFHIPLALSSSFREQKGSKQEQQQ
eukprot:10983-Heterococcus_DN1.PRE.1